MRYIILDTETTGLSFLNGDRVIEVAAVEYLNDQPTGRSVYHLLDPERSIPADAVAIHGINDEHVRGKPLFKAVAHELVEFCRGAEIVAHNANFDIGMLDNELALAGHSDRMGDVALKIVDSLRIARGLHPKMKNDLDSLMVRYEVDSSARSGGHNARVDCELLGRVYTKTRPLVNLALMDLGNMPPRRPVQPVSRPASLPRVEVPATEMAAHEALLDDMAAKGTAPVARRARMG